MKRYFAMLPVRLVLFAAALSLGVGGAEAKAKPKAPAVAPAEVEGGRFARVFDAKEDAGRLVARFLNLELGGPTRESDKAGDATILKSPDGKVMLIDGGAPPCAPQVERCLRALGVTRIDAIVASHPHIDHIGSLPAVIEAFPTGTLYMSRLEYATPAYKGLLQAAERRGVKVVRLEEGSTFQFGERVSVRVLNPEKKIEYPKGYPADSTEFINDRSLVMRLEYGRASMLFVGDVYAARERELVERYAKELKSDVVKVAHHGGNTSSIKAFVTAVSPKVAVAMHDRPGSPFVRDKYREAGAEFLATFQSGAVAVWCGESGSPKVLAQYDPPRSGKR